MPRRKGWRKREQEIHKDTKRLSRNAAEKYVFNLLRKEGRKPAFAKPGKGYDIYTRDRYIEVKGRNNRTLPAFLGLSINLFKLGKDLDKFWLYIVLGIKVKGKWKTVLKIPAKELLPKLEFYTHICISGKDLRFLAERKNVHIPSKNEREEDELHS